MMNSNVPAGTKIWVCDHPDDCSRDDYAIIEVKKQLKSNQVYCVQSFEHNFEDEIVKVTYSKKNGLDGKVSRVGAFTN